MPDTKQYTVTACRPDANGRTVVYIKCPYCGAEVRAYVWSLAGCGKRCSCGVKFNGFGTATKDKP